MRKIIHVVLKDSSSTCCPRMAREVAGLATLKICRAIPPRAAAAKAAPQRNFCGRSTGHAQNQWRSSGRESWRATRGQQLLLEQMNLRVRFFELLLAMVCNCLDRPEVVR